MCAEEAAQLVEALPNALVHRVARQVLQLEVAYVARLAVHAGLGLPFSPLHQGHPGISGRHGRLPGLLQLCEGPAGLVRTDPSTRGVIRAAARLLQQEERKWAPEN